MEIENNNILCGICNCSERQNNQFKYINKKIFFVGIGGVSVSSLAIFALNEGCKVSGVDDVCSSVTLNLEKQGIKVFYGHSAENVKDVNIVVYSNACENSVEVAYSKKNGILTLCRAEFLKEVLKIYKYPICIAGAHGKTTTTALTYEILNRYKGASLHLGGNLAETGKSYDYNNSACIVCEACEYKDSFLQLPHIIGAILNIAEEHLDYFKTFANIKKSFNEFASKSKVLVAYNKSGVSHNNLVTFGYSNADVTAKNIKMTKDGKYVFDCYILDKKFMHIKLNLIGKHNILNALASICICLCLEIYMHIDKYENNKNTSNNLNICLKNIEKTEKNDMFSNNYIKRYLQICANDKQKILNNNKLKLSIYDALANFKGVERRYQFMHKTKFVVHDYAHHPDEIISALTETFSFYKGKLLVVFQPHTYSRTKTLMQEFVYAFKNIENLLILPTYSAREKYCYQGSASKLAKNIGKNAVYIKNETKQQKYILNKIAEGYGVLLLGAGDIFALAKNIAQNC